MEENLVSVVIPVYNAERFLEDTIKTLNDQTYTNWEAIFVNDCSKDKSTEIIEEEMKKNSRIKLINLKQNSGAAIARNTGTENASGQYIAFLDADDLWNKEKLEKQVNFIKEKQCAFSYAGYEFADENGIGNGKIVNIPSQINYKQALKNPIIWTSTVMFDMKKLDKEIIKMPNFKRGQDAATWWKILRNNNIAYGLNEALAYYRRSANTLSSNKFKALKRTWYLYRQAEGFSVIKSSYYFVFYVFNAIKKRV